MLIAAHALALPPPEVNAGALSEELQQYVIYDAQPRGPHRIKLDDPPANVYTPPTSLTVHLSKIPMPELSPRAVAPKGRQQQQPAPARPPQAFPMPRTGSAQAHAPRSVSLPGNSLPRSSTSSASPPHPKNQNHNHNQRGQSMVFSAPPAPPPPQPTQQQAAWRGSIWGRSRSRK